MNGAAAAMDNSTSGFKDLTSQQIGMKNDQFKMDSGPNVYAQAMEGQNNSGAIAAGAGSSGVLRKSANNM